MPPKKQIPAKQLKTPAQLQGRGSLSLSIYAASLPPDHLDRYMVKISVIGNKDPYLLKMNNSEFPTDVAYKSIIEYALQKQSFYSGSSFRCFKAVEAKRRFESGMIKSVEGVLLGEFHVVCGKVMHSMSVNDPCLTPWIIVKGSDVQSAHCDCIAGMGEVCSHVGAVLNHLTSLNHHQLLLSQPASTQDPTSTALAVTDLEQRWGAPRKSIPGNLQMPLEDIDFGYTRDSSDDACGNVPMLWIHDIRAKLNELQSDGRKDD
nr:uncharacterized protein LOC115260985 [Aedes albopictus]